MKKGIRKLKEGVGESGIVSITPFTIVNINSEKIAYKKVDQSFVLEKKSFHK